MFDTRLTATFSGVLLAVVPSIIGSADRDTILDNPVTSFYRVNSPAATIATNVADELSVPVGFEGQAEDSEKKITVQVHEKTLKALLDAFVQADPRYDWSVSADGRIVDVYPRNVKDRFLDVTVSSFKAENKTRTAALKQLVQEPAFADVLTRLHMSMHTLIGGSSLGKPDNFDDGPKINLNLNNESLRGILNAIVVKSGGHSWAAVRYGNRLQYLSLSLG